MVADGDGQDGNGTQEGKNVHTTRSRPASDPSSRSHPHRGALAVVCFCCGKTPRVSCVSCGEVFCSAACFAQQHRSNEGRHHPQEPFDEAKYFEKLREMKEARDKWEQPHVEKARTSETETKSKLVQI